MTTICQNVYHSLSKDSFCLLYYSFIFKIRKIYKHSLRESILEMTRIIDKLQFIISTI